VDRLRRFTREVLSTGFRPFVASSRKAQRYPRGTTNPVAKSVDQAVAKMVDHKAVPFAMMPNNGWIEQIAHGRKNSGAPSALSKSVA
jgi:hypothetical protein